jgi:KaiC/GvpD/RAD55 family RecA-like ATPase
MDPSRRHSTGIPRLDDLLGGGLLPGTLTVIAGATGIGKTQFGLQFARAGLAQEGKPGLFFDMSARGDSQSHHEYARRMFGWELTAADSRGSGDAADFFSADRDHGDYLHVFDYRGRRVTRRDMDWDDWHAWQAQLNHKLQGSIAFLFGNFTAGKQRVVIDGIEPAERPHESIQLNLFEYVYHQILRKDPQWVARDLFRENYRRHAGQSESHAYDPAGISCLLLYTSHEMMLDDLIGRRLDEGDALSNANTLIYMGKIRRENQVARGLYVAKHRGSACSDDIIPFRVTDDGIRLE